MNENLFLIGMLVMIRQMIIIHFTEKDIKFNFLVVVILLELTSNYNEKKLDDFMKNFQACFELYYVKLSHYVIAISLLTSQSCYQVENILRSKKNRRSIRSCKRNQKASTRQTRQRSIRRSSLVEKTTRQNAGKRLAYFTRRFLHHHQRFEIHNYFFRPLLP